MERKRCKWVNLDNPLYVEYHDKEWGRPLHDDQRLFRLLILEGFQAGLSWETILNKRENFRRAFRGFDPKVMAEFGPDDVERLMADRGIVRNRLKIVDSIVNAKAFLKLQREEGSFDRYIWSFTDGKSLREPYALRTTSEPVRQGVERSQTERLQICGFYHHLQLLAGHRHYQCPWRRM